jgi:hypothetical protein
MVEVVEKFCHMTVTIPAKIPDSWLNQSSKPAKYISLQISLKLF